MTRQPPSNTLYSHPREYIRLLAFAALLVCTACVATSRKSTIAGLRELAETAKEKPPLTTGVFFDSQGIVAYAPSSNAKKAGIRRKDQIINIEGVSVTSENYEDAIRIKFEEHKAGDEFSVEILRDGRPKTLRVKLQKRRVAEISTAVADDIKAGRFESALDRVDAENNDRESPTPPAILKYFRATIVGAQFDQRAHQQALWNGFRPAVTGDVIRHYMLYAREQLRAAALSSDVLEESTDRLEWLADWMSEVGHTANALEIRRGLQEAIDASQTSEQAPTRPTAPVAVQTGTGFCISKDGLIATAYHVVEGTKEINVRFEDGRVASAQIAQSNASNDLAILRVDLRDLTACPLSRASTASLGERVYTIGYPATGVLGQEAKFTDGAVSAFSGIGGEASLIQISVPTQPGNSGGPIVRESGEVIGIVTSTAAVPNFVKSTGTLPQNVNFAVKADYLMLLTADLSAPSTASMTRKDGIERTLSSLCFIEAR